MKNQFQLFLLVFLTGSLISCVPKKDFLDLENRFHNLESEHRLLNKKFQQIEAENLALNDKLKERESTIEGLQNELDQLRIDYESKAKQLKNLEESYSALEKNSSQLLAENLEQNRALLSQLEEKERALAQEKLRLENLQKDLEERSNRIQQLEDLIATKEEKLSALKNKLSEALIDFEGRGLSVEQRNGKVYVSMENKLLFASGSWTVGSEGKKAIKELANILAQNSDISVLIEGHTDNVPYGGKGPLKDNWDLSTKRATEVLKLLLNNPAIDPENLTAAGRGEYLPVATNETKDGKAKNRRIEVVLEPRLDELNKLINE
jgi:chemotaxis protein MotB